MLANLTAEGLDYYGINYGIRSRVTPGEVLYCVIRKEWESGKVGVKLFCSQNQQHESRNLTKPKKSRPSSAECHPHWTNDATRTFLPTNRRPAATHLPCTARWAHARNLAACGRSTLTI